MDFCANPTTIKDTFFSERLHRVKKKYFFRQRLATGAGFCGCLVKVAIGKSLLSETPKIEHFNYTLILP